MRCAKALAGLALLALAGCAGDPQPVLVRPEIPPSLFACPPAPAKPSAGAVYDLVARANAWAAAYDACACRLGLVQRLLDGRPVGDPTQACPTVPAEGQRQAPAGAPEDPDPPPD
jgi:hypothetical protein